MILLCSYVCKIVYVLKFELWRFCIIEYGEKYLIAGQISGIMRDDVLRS